MPLFGRLNDIEVESCEVEEGMSKMKGGKAPGLDRCTGEFLRKGGRSLVGWLVRLPIVVLRLGEFQGTGAGYALPRSIIEKVTDASAETPGA